jgi:methylglyoxal reductase
MRTAPLGQSLIHGSVVALGTWVMGGWMWGGVDEDEAVRAIHAALDLGINLLDTAPIYGFGWSEVIVGRALKGRRDKAVIATKCGMIPTTPGRPVGRSFFRSTALGGHEHGHIEISIWNHPDSITRECELSLKRLGTDYIDLYQTHWQEEETRFEDTMAALLKLKAQGKIRAIGVCNANVAQMKRYQAQGPLDTDQEKYSMLDRGLDAEQLPWCRANNVAVLAYSPLVLGLLTGKAPPEREFPEGDLRRTAKRFSRENRERIAQMLARFEPIARAHDCTLGQLAIAWTIHQPGVTHALVGARSVDQVEENAKAASVLLTQAELDTMNAAIAETAPTIV